MQVDQGILSMLSGPDRGSASVCGASHSKSSNQDTGKPDLANKGSEEPSLQDGGSKEIPSDKRERESPDTTTKPEGKSLKTTSAASSTQTQEFTNKGGTHTATDPNKGESSGKEEQPTTNWH